MLSLPPELYSMMKAVEIKRRRPSIVSELDDIHDWRYQSLMMVSNYMIEDEDEAEPLLLISKTEQQHSSSSSPSPPNIKVPIKCFHYPEIALKLLGSGTASNTYARRFGVFLLRRSKDEELELYLLQLINALVHEDFEIIKTDLHLQIFEKTTKKKEKMMLTRSESAPDLKNRHRHCLRLRRARSSSLFRRTSCCSSDLATFLIDRCCNNLKLANNLYWYLMTECESQSQICGDIRIQEMYIIVLKRFLMKLEREKRNWHEKIQSEYEFVRELVNIIREVRSCSSGSRQKMQAILIEKLRKFDNSGEEHLLPTDPNIRYETLIPEKTEVFKADSLPCKLVFRVPGLKSEIGLLFKTGNDLRQDQLTVELITLFDRILKRHGMDLKLTPYKVLATSSTAGFVEFVDESRSVASVLKDFGTILQFFTSVSRNDDVSDIVDNFVKSCAGYCVITYVLGIGDRHLDNLLITKDGRLFHVDFGYILGTDPKPLPPPMKLTKEMIEAMGGSKSYRFQQFRQFCHTTFLILRRNSELILNLFSLMSTSTIPALSRLPHGRVVSRVRDNLVLELSEAAAIKHIDHLIHLSSSAVVATFVERLHTIAQSMRK